MIINQFTSLLKITESNEYSQHKNVSMLYVNKIEITYYLLIFNATSVQINNKIHYLNYK